MESKNVGVPTVNLKIAKTNKTRIRIVSSVFKPNCVALHVCFDTLQYVVAFNFNSLILWLKQ